MADQIVAEYKLDVNQASKALDTLQQEYAKTEAASKKAGQTANESFLKGSDGAKRFNDEVKKQPQTLAELELKLNNLRELLRDDTKIGTEGFKRVTAEIKKTEAAIDAANGKIKETGQQGQSLIGIFKKIGTTLGIAFGAQQLITFGREAVELAAKGEGIRHAFERLNDPTLLDRLRQATRGTISDLELMAKATFASQMGVELDKLPRILEFARRVAKDTGKDFEFLSEQIVVGIGRKSTQRLDDFGITSDNLKAKLNGLSIEAASTAQVAEAVFQIATEQLQRMGNEVDTTADKISQIGTAFENAWLKGGDALILILKDIDDAWERFTNITAFRAKKANDALNESFKEGSQLATLRIQRIEKEKKTEEDRISAIQKALSFADQQYEKEQKNIEQLEHRIEVGDFRGIQGIKELKSIKEQIAVSEQYSESLLAQIDVYAKYIDNSNLLTGTQKKQIKNVAYYKALIKQLEEEQSAENTTLERNTQLNQKLTVAREELAKLLGKQTKAQKEYNEALKEMPIKEVELRFGDYVLKGEDGNVVFRYLGDTVDGLNQLLQEQKQILESSPEFSQKYNDSAAAIDKLQKKLKEFNDDQIDPSKGYDVSATGLGLLPETQTLEEQLDEQKQLYSAYYGELMNLASIFQAAQQRMFDTELTNLQLQLEQGLITREQYDEKRKQLMREQAEAQKEAAIFEATINGIQAVVQAYSQDPTGVLAAIVAAAVAAEVATIASQPLPQFAEGGFVDPYGQLLGRKHSSGGIKIEAEGGEYITAAKYAQPNKDVLKAINSGKWEKYKVENIIAPAIEEVLKGGFAGMAGSYQLNAMFNDRNLLKLGDRNRQAAHEDAKYIVSELSKHLKGRKRGGFN